MNKQENRPKMVYPEPGKTYRHYKGGLYRVLNLAVDANDNSIRTISYQSVHFGTYYTRTLAEWMEPVKAIGTNPDVTFERYTLEE